MNIEKIVEFFKKNNRVATTVEIAKYAGISPSLAFHNLHKLGIPRIREGCHTYWGRQKHIDIMLSKQAKIQKDLKEVLGG